MPEYLVRVERQDNDHGVWNIVGPDEIVRDDRSARALCDEMARHRTLADDHKWRVSVWIGHTPTGQAAAERYSLRDLGTPQS